MDILLSLRNETPRAEMRAFVERLRARIGDAKLAGDEIDRLIAFGDRSGAGTLERRARTLEKLLAVAGSLLGDALGTACWIRMPNPGLGGIAPLDELLAHDHALDAMCAALIDEHRTVFRGSLR